MSRILKSDKAAHAQGLALNSVLERTQSSPTALELENTAQARRIEALSVELVAKERVIEQLERQSATAYSDGEAQGRLFGRNEAQQASAEQLALLSGATSEAIRLFKAELSSLERLAPLLARQGLERVLGDCRGHADLVSGVIHHQLQDLDSGAVVRVEVSSADFDGEELRDLRNKIGETGAEVVARSQLSSGACRVRLRLGVMDIGLDQQWPRLSELLEQAARAEPLT